MHSAPPVGIHCIDGGHDRWWLVGWLAASLAAFGVSLLWCGLHWPWDNAAMRVARALSPALCLLLSAAGLHRAWHITRQGWQLRWDGQCWWWHLPAQVLDADAGQVRVAVDLGGWLLLHFRPDPVSMRRRGTSAGTWLTASHTRYPSEWHLLRCAVYSPRPAAPAMPAATHHPGVSCPATAPDER
ncbi:MAG: hypothetical protein ABI574_04375 [Burkholderiales bacterium]